MAKSKVRVICGTGTGKSAAALGYAMMGIFQGKRVIMVQFLKGVLDAGASEVLKKLEPDLKVFQFERSHGLFADLPKKQQEEDILKADSEIEY